MTARPELRATYRLQLTPEFGFAHARARVPYLRDLGVSHLYLSPALQARPGSTHGYDVIDPGRLSEELGGRAEFERLATAAHEAGLGLILDVVPNHMAADDANRFWADPALRERFFDIDPATGKWRRFFDITDLAAVRQEDQTVFEQTHELVLSLVRDGLVDGLRVDHPDGLADPAEYLTRLRDRGAERVWVEKILGSDEHLREWPVSGTVGYEFLDDVCALFVDPAGEAALTGLWERVSGDSRSFGEVALEAKLEQIHGSLRPELERLGRELGVSLAGRSRHARAGGGVAACVPHLRRAGDGARRRGGPRRRFAQPEMPAGARGDAAARARRPGGVRDPLPADDAGGDGQGRRGHRLLPLRTADRFERGRRRSGALRDQRRAVPRGMHGASAPLPAEPPDHADPRRQALRRRPGADRRACVDAGGVGGSGFEMDGAHRFAVLGRGARQRRALLPVPDARRRLADRARARAAVHGEGAARGQAQHQLDRAQSGMGGVGRVDSARLCTSTGTFWTSSSRSRAGWRPPASAPCSDRWS